VHFNISHSGNYAGCVISDKFAGFDVEQHKITDLSLSKHFFTGVEHQYICSPDESALNRFYQIWTLKESYIKAIGKGLSCPLDSFSVINDNKVQLHLHDKNLPIMNLHSLHMSNDYSAAVCCDPSIDNRNEHFVLTQDVFLNEFSEGLL
jgi:4'-phosphopantetheinyl transferase